MKKKTFFFFKTLQKCGKCALPECLWWDQIQWFETTFSSPSLRSSHSCKTTCASFRTKVIRWLDTKYPTTPGVVSSPLRPSKETMPKGFNTWLIVIHIFAVVPVSDSQGMIPAAAPASSPVSTAASRVTIASRALKQSSPVHHTIPYYQPPFQRSLFDLS